MSLRALIKEPGIRDIVQTPRGLYVLTTDPSQPQIYSDKDIFFINADELLVSEHLAEILSGESLLHGELREHNHLREELLYTYDLSGLSASQKQSFSHELTGTGGRNSLLASIHGTKMGRCVVRIPASQREKLHAFFDKHAVAWSAERILREERP